MASNFSVGVVIGGMVGSTFRSAVRLQEVDEFLFDGGAGGRLVVDLVPHARLHHRAHVLAAVLPQRVRQVVGTLAVVGNRILIAGQDEHR